MASGNNPDKPGHASGLRRSDAGEMVMTRSVGDRIPVPPGSPGGVVRWRPNRMYVGGARRDMEMEETTWTDKDTFPCPGCVDD